MDKIYLLVEFICPSVADYEKRISMCDRVSYRLQCFEDVPKLQGFWFYIIVREFLYFAGCFKAI